MSNSTQIQILQAALKKLNEIKDEAAAKAIQQIKGVPEIDD